MAAFRAGDAETATALSDRLLLAARSAGDAPAEIDGLCMLARIALRHRRIQQVQTLAEEARSVARAAQQPRLERMPLHLQAVAARLQGDLSTARRLYEESIVLNRTLGEERMVAAEFHNLGYVELRDGHLDRARELFGMALAEARRLDHKPLFPYLVADAAVLAAESGDLVLAARLMGAARAAFSAAEQVPDPDDAAEHDRLQEHLIRMLGEETFRSALDAGAELSLEEALRGAE